MSATAPAETSASVRARGLWFGLAAYAWWALVFPLHLKLLNSVAPEAVVAARLTWSAEVLAHRVVWSLVFCLVLCAGTGRMPALGAALRDRRAALRLTLCAGLVTVNWLVFIVAMARGELYRAGIGYFVTPIVQIALGTLLLGERLRRLQWCAIALAVGGMLVLVAIGMSLGGEWPWIEASLAGSFGFYGLLRKQTRVGPVVGLTVETGVLTPIAVLWLWLAPSAFGAPLGFVVGDAATDALLIATGVSTALPLLCFAAAAARLPLSTVGFLQFLAPTGQVLLGVLAFGERPADPSLWWGYALIWAGVLVLIGEGAVRLRSRSRA